MGRFPMGFKLPYNETLEENSKIATIKKKIAANLIKVIPFQ